MKKKTIYLLLISILLISPILGRHLQEIGNQVENNQDQNQNNQNQEENNQEQNQQEVNNQNQNQEEENNQEQNQQDGNNQDQNQEGGKQQEGGNQQEAGNYQEEENQQDGGNQHEGGNYQDEGNYQEEGNPIIEGMKSGVPDFIYDMTSQSSSFSKLDSEQQMTKLNEEKNNLGSITEQFQNSQTPENRKVMMEKATEIAGFLTKKDCSSSTSSETSEDSNFHECRAQKKEIMTDIISLVKDYVKCENIDTLISSGVSEDKQENFKYILFLIYEVSSNPDSLKEGESEILYDVTLCLQENFDTYWSSVATDITSDSDKGDVKQDVSLILIKTLSNLVNVHRYDEIDGYLETTISESGLMINDQAKKIHKGMLEFAQKFNDFGNGTYNVSSSMNISVLKFDDLEDTTLLNTEQEYDLEDKGIIIKFKPRKMMSDTEGNTMQFISYDSPLVSTNSSNEDNNIVRDFVSLAIFDDTGKEVSINDLPEDARPEIYYSQSQNKSMKMCYFYNELNGDLDTKGMAGENITIKGKEYLKCSSEHLTSFTASYRLPLAKKTSGNSDTTGNTGAQAKSSANTISLMKWLCIVYILLI